MSVFNKVNVQIFPLPTTYVSSCLECYSRNVANFTFYKIAYAVVKFNCAALFRKPLLSLGCGRISGPHRIIILQ